MTNDAATATADERSGARRALLGAGLAVWNGRLRWLVRSSEAEEDPEEDGLGRR